MLRKELPLVESIQPQFIEPMYAEAARELPDSGDWSYESKLDGKMCLSHASMCSQIGWVKITYETRQTQRNGILSSQSPFVCRP